MKTGFSAFIVLAMVSGIVACGSSQTKTAKAQEFQVVEFTEAEVPYIQAVKKDGKMSATIVYSKDAATK